MQHNTINCSHHVRPSDLIRLIESLYQLLPDAPTIQTSGKYFATLPMRSTFVVLDSTYK